MRFGCFFVIHEGPPKKFEVALTATLLHIRYLWQGSLSRLWPEVLKLPTRPRDPAADTKKGTTPVVWGGAFPVGAGASEDRADGGLEVTHVFFGQLPRFHRIPGDDGPQQRGVLLDVAGDAR